MELNVMTGGDDGADDIAQRLLADPRGPQRKDFSTMKLALRPCFDNVVS